MTKLKLVTCHRKPERSFFYKGQQFPVCARCTGIYLGFLIMPLTLFNVVQLSFLLSLVITIPSLLDGFIQSQTNYKSNNYIRLFTGIFAGVGLMGLSTAFADFCGSIIF